VTTVLTSAPEDREVRAVPADAAAPLAPAVFPGDAAEGAATIGASASARAKPARHGWRVLAILSALMGFASISTDLYLPAMPAMSRALGADAGTVEWTSRATSSASAWGSSCGGRSATVMVVARRWRSGSCCS
jgi:MFS transporter, DHA1 family, multidrug resistance protein